MDLTSTTIVGAGNDVEITIMRSFRYWSLYINGQFEAFTLQTEIMDYGDQGVHVGIGADKASNPCDGAFYRMRMSRVQRYLPEDYTPEVGNSYAYP